VTGYFAYRYYVRIFGSFHANSGKEVNNDSKTTSNIRNLEALTVDIIIMFLYCISMKLLWVIALINELGKISAIH
jgi:hypothetical protein